MATDKQNHLLRGLDAVFRTFVEAYSNQLLHTADLLNTNRELTNTPEPRTTTEEIYPIQPPQKASNSGSEQAE